MTSPGSPKPRRRRSTTVAGLIVAVAVAAVIAGCGSSSSSSSASATGAAATGASSAVGLQQAQAALQVAEQRPTTLNLPAVTKPIPAGKTISFVHCGVAVCDTIVSAIKNAAGVLGWKVDAVASSGTPASVKAAWDSVVRLRPDAAFGSGFNRSLFASEASQLSSMHVPIMDWSTLDPTGNGITFVKGGLADVPVVGKQMAAWVVTSTQGKANTVYVDLPTYVILGPVKTGFVAAYKQWCAGCALDTMSVPLTSIGTTAPGLIVSYLRAHPSVNRVVLSYDGIGVGLPAALKAAGLDSKVQFVGEAPTATNLSYVQNGTEAATVSQGYYEIWATFVDAAARALTGQSLAPDIAWKAPWFLVTKTNMSQGTGYTPVVPNLDAQLKKIWNK